MADGDEQGAPRERPGAAGAPGGAAAERRGSGMGERGEQSGGSVVINRSPRRQDALTFRAGIFGLLLGGPSGHFL